jgi:hypothetical protein
MRKIAVLFTVYSGYFVCFFVVFLLSACDAIYSKDDYIQDFRSFVIEVKKSSHVYTDKDWMVAEVKYKRYSEELYSRFRGELTEQDKYMISRFNGIYSALRLKQNAYQTLRGVKDLSGQAKGFIEGSIEGLK